MCLSISCQGHPTDTPKDLSLMKTESNVRVGKLICMSCSEKDYPLMTDFAKKFPGRVVPCYGIHPWFAHQVKEGWLERLEKVLACQSTPFMGEIGLDKISKTEGLNLFFSRHFCNY